MAKDRMRSKEEIALVWIALGIITIPFVVLNPGILVFALIGYCLYVLHDHYIRQKGPENMGIAMIVLVFIAVLAIGAWLDEKSQDH